MLHPERMELEITLLPGLYVLGLPIGDPTDLTLKGKYLLENSEILIGEEFRPLSTFLKKLNIQREFELLNEHSTKEEISEILEKVRNVKISCLVSDVGTPTLEDPGLELVKLARAGKIPVHPAPGPSAVIAALSVSGFVSSPFQFCGFLNRERNLLRSEFRQFLKTGSTLAFYETPYRYKKFIQEILDLVPAERKIFLGLDLSTDREIQICGSVSEFRHLDWSSLPKANPVILIEGNSKNTAKSRRKT